MMNWLFAALLASTATDLVLLLLADKFVQVVPLTSSAASLFGGAPDMPIPVPRT